MMDSRSQRAAALEEKRRRLEEMKKKNTDPRPADPVVVALAAPIFPVDEAASSTDAPLVASNKHFYDRATQTDTLVISPPSSTSSVTTVSDMRTQGGGSNRPLSDDAGHIDKASVPRPKDLSIYAAPSAPLHFYGDSRESSLTRASGDDVNGSNTNDIMLTLHEAEGRPVGDIDWTRHRAEWLLASYRSRSVLARTSVAVIHGAPCADDFILLWDIPNKKVCGPRGKRFMPVVDPSLTACSLQLPLSMAVLALLLLASTAVLASWQVPLLVLCFCLITE